MALRSASLLLIPILLIGIVSADTSTPKNVQAAVRAKWFGTPLLLEAGYLLLPSIFVFSSISILTVLFLQSHPTYIFPFFFSFAASCCPKRSRAFSGTSFTHGSTPITATPILIPPKAVSTKFYNIRALF